MSALTIWPPPLPGPSWWSRLRGPPGSLEARRCSSNSLPRSWSSAGDISDSRDQMCSEFHQHLFTTMLFPQICVEKQSYKPDAEKMSHFTAETSDLTRSLASAGKPHDEADPEIRKCDFVWTAADVKMSDCICPSVPLPIVLLSASTEVLQEFSFLVNAFTRSNQILMVLVDPVNKTFSILWFQLQ